MSWRLAKSLLTLREQVDAAHPDRDRASDGTIGDLAHAARRSDHNPVAGVVHAWDVTHDPAHFDAHRWAREVLVGTRDSRLKYVISNGEVWDPVRGWHAYHGPNPHNHHVHISVNETGGDDPRTSMLEPVRPFRVIVDGIPTLGAFRNPSGVTMVPLRQLADALGLVTHYDEATNTVTVTKPA